MKFPSLILGVLMAAATLAGALRSPLDGYTAVPMRQTGINNTDGTTVVVSGTVQEIRAEMDAMGSSVNWTMTSDSDEDIFCWVGGSGKVEGGPLQDGINYLKKHDRPCTADPGPRVCARISCSWNSAIWLCNDTPNGISHACADLATYVEDIREECHVGVGRELLIQGQQFDTENFNVLVGKDNC
ncbi:Uu.00g120230.m01.CDS01 [Anthostomella pinea]|uniref:Uu.00g120230.m01.CDS01 n=1 Tax=Anthostomella pinea TaxID=933095 RepID=A0AAI8VHS7_9PEZI|nr:Uu.00g120230.m01.CDS01 [Anthostomella pinea]